MSVDPLVPVTKAPSATLKLTQRYKGPLRRPEGLIPLILVDTFLALAAVTPSPSPSPQFDESIVTPGPVGFLVIFGIAVATVLLVLDMVRRVRRTRYRGELRERLEREAAEQGGRESTTDGSTPRD